MTVVQTVGSKAAGLSSALQCGGGSALGRWPDEGEY